MTDRSIMRDGYTDIPPGKLAAIATALEMRARPPSRPVPDVAGVTLRHVLRPDVGWYRDLFRRIGEPWLWQSRLRLAPAALEAIIRAPNIEIWALAMDGRDEGLLELDFREPRTCELTFFGLTQACVGQGAGRTLMHHAIERAWRRPIERLWVHTCTFDHPAALPFYIRSGFLPYKRMIEVFDDPRLNGTLSPGAGRGVPIIAVDADLPRT